MYAISALIILCLGLQAQDITASHIITIPSNVMAENCELKIG